MAPSYKYVCANVVVFDRANDLKDSDENCATVAAKYNISLEQFLRLVYNFLEKSGRDV